jgi:hypothetical protein
VVGSFLRRLIDVRTLSWPLRLALAWIIFQTIVIGVLIVLRDVPQPRLTVSTLSAVTTTAPPFSAYGSPPVLPASWTQPPHAGAPPTHPSPEQGG